MSAGSEMIPPLELLERTARRAAAVVCLTVDHRDHSTLIPGASLSELSVVRPAAGLPTRRERIQRGTVLAAAPVDDAVRLEEVAEQLVRDLMTLLLGERRRS